MSATNTRHSASYWKDDIDRPPAPALTVIFATGLPRMIRSALANPNGIAAITGL